MENSDSSTKDLNQDPNLKTNMRKVALTALAGTSIEWYDFFLYGAAAALVFPTVFFGESEPATAYILSFLTFAAGFIARPIGGIIFGHFGDRIGRKRTLVMALLLMGISSTFIGLLPTYAMIGVTAPILLTVLRFAQGLAIGGQWGGFNQVHYAVSKAGLISFTQSIARIYSKDGITSNAISIGLVATDMSIGELNTEAGKEKIKNIPIGRLGTKEEIAKIALFLASDDASYVTGQTINANGGMYFG